MYLCGFVFSWELLATLSSHSLMTGSLATSTSRLSTSKWTSIVFFFFHSFWLSSQLYKWNNRNTRMYKAHIWYIYIYILHPSVFPTMPRHNFVHVAPLLRELCEKHGVQYQVKGLLEAMSDIIGYDCGLLYSKIPIFEHLHNFFFFLKFSTTDT